MGMASDVWRLLGALFCATAGLWPGLQVSLAEAEPNWPTELIKTSPIAGAIIGVVMIFLAYIKRRDIAMQRKDEAFLSYIRQRDVDEAASQRSRDERLQALGDSCHLVQREMMARYEAATARTAAALDRNTEAFVRTAQALGRVEERLEAPPPPARAK